MRAEKRQAPRPAAALLRPSLVQAPALQKVSLTQALIIHSCRRCSSTNPGAATSFCSSLAGWRPRSLAAQGQQESLTCTASVRVVVLVGHERLAWEAQCPAASLARARPSCHVSAPLRPLRPAGIVMWEVLTLQLPFVQDNVFLLPGRIAGGLRPAIPPRGQVPGPGAAASSWSRSCAAMHGAVAAARLLALPPPCGTRSPGQVPLLGRAPPTVADWQL